MRSRHSTSTRRVGFTARQEDGQLRRPAQLPPLLRRRGRQPGNADHVLRVAALRARAGSGAARSSRSGSRRPRSRRRWSSRIRTGCGSRLYPGETRAPARRGGDRQPRPLRGPLRRGRAAHFAEPLEEPALIGAGTTHHIAWRAKDDAEQEAGSRGSSSSACARRPCRTASTSARSTSGCPTASWSRSPRTTRDSSSTSRPSRSARALAAAVARAGARDTGARARADRLATATLSAASRAGGGIGRRARLRA